MAQAGTKDNPITGPYRATKLVITFIIKFEILQYLMFRCNF